MSYELIEENNNVTETIVEAAIVRIMKARRVLDHNNIVAEVTKQLNKQESGLKVMDSMESDGFQLVQNKKKKDVLGSERSVGGSENLGNLTSGVKVATGTPKAKVSFHNASIRKPQDEYKILVFPLGIHRLSMFG
ncbi:3'-5' exonuclease domain-containing protein [Artemisia annua]|uniref:3'-5' exonuclease domain-containing protein n=1 Tax=Artemisia annua TaxID=35608 RepID=A0A2U1PFF6_ARTAN|nr:3'-5' exonuclease domain-containing protein [Artemisia annua]